MVGSCDFRSLIVNIPTSIIHAITSIPSALNRPSEHIDELSLLKLANVQDDPYGKDGVPCVGSVLRLHTEALWSLLSLDEKSQILLELDHAAEHAEL